LELFEEIRIQKRHILNHVPGAGDNEVGLPSVDVIWGETLRRQYGVAAHVNFQTSVYQNVGAGGWIDMLSDMNGYYFRSLYSQSLSNNPTAISRARTKNVKWLMTVATSDFTMSGSEIRQRIQHIAANAADVCVAVEGINEPNNTNDANWADKTVSAQAAIFDEVTSTPALSHVIVIGPSLHATINSAQQDHITLGNKGIQNYFHQAGLHRYSGARAPNYLIDERLGWIATYWDHPPVWVTETGYTNAVNESVGQTPINEGGSDKYAIRNVTEYLARPAVSHVTRYEFLDDPNPAKDDSESNFGLVRTDVVGNTSGWTFKPEYSTMQDFLGTLKDTAGSYAPPPIPLQVTAGANEIDYIVTKTTTGHNFLWVWRPDTTVWNISTLANISVPSIPVTYTTQLGTFQVNVAGAAVKVDLGF